MGKWWGSDQIPNLDSHENIKKIIKGFDAIGFYLSGAETTIMLALKADDENSEKEIWEKLENLSDGYELKAL